MKCLPVERSRRESRSSHKVTKTRSEAPTRNTSSQNMNPTMNNVGCSFANIDIPDFDLSRNIPMSESPEILSAFSPNTLCEELSGSSSFPHENPSPSLCMGDTLEAKDDIDTSDVPLLPAIGIDIAPSGIPIQNPANLKFGTRYVEPRLPCHKNEQCSSSDLRWQEMFDMMIQSSGSAPKACQCLDRALELLDGLFIQDGSLTNPLSTSESNYPNTTAAMQRLSILRMELNGLESIATCAQCKGAPCLMSLLVSLSERLSAKFRKIVEMVPVDPLETGIHFEITSTPMSLKGDPSKTGENDMQSREYNIGSKFETQAEERNIKMVLSCGAFTLDMSMETEALLLTLALLAMQQLRKVVATLWGRAQDEQRKDLSENLTRCGQRLHSMNAVLKAKLTKEYA